MATTFGGHGLSSLTNSCVKVPINPRNRLAATFTERGGSFKPKSAKKTEDEQREWENDTAQNGTRFAHSNPSHVHHRHSHSHSHDSHNGNGYFETENGFTSTDMDDGKHEPDDYQDVHARPRPDQLFENLKDNIDAYTDEEFYKKLMEMKDEHRKTLNRLEVLYDQKLSLSGHENIPKTNFELEEQPFTKSGPVYIGDHKLRHIDDEIEQFTKSQDWSTKKDNVKDMSAKPPIGRPKTAWAGKSRRSLRRSMPSEKWSDITWTNDSGQDTSGSELDASNASTTRSRRTLNLSDSYSASQDMVGRMWDDFSVEEYAPRARSNSRASSVKSTGSVKSKEWSPKITIPKPFQMTQREAMKEKTKSRACMELEQELAEKEKAEEVECQRKFKATPAPAHTYMPLYDEINERDTERSRRNRENSKDRLVSQQKPFSFMKREEEKKKHRRSKSLPLTQAKGKKPKQFKAREIPKTVFDPTVSDRILEEEEYRKIRIKMRAEEMLMQSSLPQNMQHRGKEYTDGKMRRNLYKKREKMAFLTTEHKFQPQVNGEVPDYDELYRQFQQEVQRKKQEKEPTVVQPFNLRTSRIPSKMDKILDEMKQEEDGRKEKLRGSTSKSLSLRSSLNISEDAIPAKTTAASKLRKSATEKTLKEQAEKEREEAERERQKRIKERKLKQFINRKALANDNSESLSATSKSKRQNYIEAGRSRQAEYDQQLKEMMTRVESRPLLFERQSQVNAKKAAEKKYQQALKEAGLDEEFLVRKGRSGSTQASARSYDYPDDSDEDLTFGRHEDRDMSFGSSKGGAGLRSEGGSRGYDNDFDDEEDDDENRSISSIHTEEA
ncbi:protein FAM161B-like [Patiria miniata]|uniref:Protein FAM161A n=1 Tax=Patiria miniata TaxID=46514 RepID=A0A914BAI5_PATMI|nr:protein FAM161B-like [Patiria miniata]